MAKARLRSILLLTATCTTLAACDEPFDFDLRGLGDGFDTSEAARQASAPRPKPDDRGIISYPNYQVAVARQGDRIGDVAKRVGLPAEELARYNGIPTDAVLRRDEVVALPSRVAEPSPATGAATTGPLQPAETIDITTIAGGAIDRAGAQSGSSSAISPPEQPQPTPAAAPAPAAPVASASGAEPTRHKVARGETAYAIARRYNVTVKDLAEWNGLGTDLALRAGQFLLIPVASQKAPVRPAPAPVTETPGSGSTTPVPPSAVEPLPDEKTEIAAAAPKNVPASPDLGSQRTSGSAKFAAPVPGAIIRDYEKGKSSFILYKAGPGTDVKMAQNGTVKLISKNADGVEIMVVDHGGGLQTAYSFINTISVSKGDSVKRGQSVAKVAENEFGALQFMVFKGTQTVDPTPYLN